MAIWYKRFELASHLLDLGADCQSPNEVMLETLAYFVDVNDSFFG